MSISFTNMEVTRWNYWKVESSSFWEVGTEGREACLKELVFLFSRTGLFDFENLVHECITKKLHFILTEKKKKKKS